MATVNCYLILILFLAGPDQNLIVIEQVEVIKQLASHDSLPVIVFDVKPLKTSCVRAEQSSFRVD